MTYYLFIPEGHQDKDIVIDAIQNSGLNYRLVNHSDSDLIELCSGLKSFIGTESVLQRAGRAKFYSK